MRFSKSIVQEINIEISNLLPKVSCADSYQMVGQPNGIGLPNKPAVTFKNLPIETVNGETIHSSHET